MGKPIGVFVSSTIRECAAERAAARRAIESLAHRPVLFEDLGARPHPPRSVYLRELRDADVFVGIYRKKYGYVDAKIGISGVHDEHVLRRELDLPALVYVLEDDAGRDARLSNLIGELLDELTVSFYSAADDLEERIRDDVAGLVALGFDSVRLRNLAGDVHPARRSSSTDAVAEVTAFLALSPQGRRLDELAAAMVASNATVIRTLEEAGPGLVSVAGDRAILVGTRPLTHIENEFYSTALAKVLCTRGQFCEAIALYDAVGHPDARTILGRAVREAVGQGDVAGSIPLLQRQIDSARETSSQDLAVSGLLTLAVLLAESGKAGDARAALDAAETAASTDWLDLIRQTSLELDVATRGDPVALERLRELGALRLGEGDRIGAARIAVELSRFLIGAHQFREAAQQADFALRVFRENSDTYGARVAMTNLAAALSGTGEGGAVLEELLAELQQDPESLRAKAFRLNLEARRARRAGNATRARELSAQAVLIGEELGDLRLELTNRVNLGNALRDLGHTNEALSVYTAVAVAAAAAGMRVKEAAATRLVASVLVDQRRFSEGLHNARHAAGLSSTTHDSINFGEAKREEGRCLEGVGDPRGAFGAYVDGASRVHATGDHKFAAELILDALRCAESNGMTEAIVGGLLRGFGRIVPEDPLEGVIALGRSLVELLSPLSPRHRTAICRSFFGQLLSGFAPAARGRVVDALSQEIMGMDTAGLDRLQVALCLLAAHVSPETSLKELVAYVERCFRAVPDVTFKPYDDGAAHWTIRLALGEGIVGTVKQMDDTPLAFVCSALVIYFLKAIESQLAGTLGVRSTPRSEFVLVVTTRREFVELVGAEHAPPEDEVVAVTRAADEQSEPPPEIIIILGDQYSPRSDANLELGARVAHELSRHLLRGGIDDAVLARHTAPLGLQFII
jgi:tetratricopeptide (TPR) repeat protein